MRRLMLTPMTATLLLSMLVAGCSREEEPKASPAFCKAVDRYNSELERQLEGKEIDPERELERVEELARTAPKAIRDDAKTFRDSLRNVASDPSLKDDPEIREAVDNVNRFANKACGLYSGGSGI
jgi:hypothetical protein